MTREGKVGQGTEALLLSFRKWRTREPACGQSTKQGKGLWGPGVAQVTGASSRQNSRALSFEEQEYYGAPGSPQGIRCH